MHLRYGPDLCSTEVSASCNATHQFSPLSGLLSNFQCMITGCLGLITGSAIWGLYILGLVPLSLQEIRQVGNTDPIYSREWQEESVITNVVPIVNTTIFLSMMLTHVICISSPIFPEDGFQKALGKRASSLCA